MSCEEIDNLENPISLAELKKAIQGMKKRENHLGGMEYPPEFYLCFWDELGQFMLDMILASMERGFFDRDADANLAILTVLPKPNKNSTVCSSYRHLSILNADIIIHAKVLACLMEKHMTKLVHHDQTGFIRSCQASDNICRILHVLHFSRDNNSPCMVLSLDAEKVFDRLE